MELPFWMTLIWALAGLLSIARMYDQHTINLTKHRAKISRHQSYAIYMNMTNELMKNIRPPESILSRLSIEYLKIHSDYDSDIVPDLLVEYKRELLRSFNRATNPIGLMGHELNALLLNCSEEVAVLAREMKKLASYFKQEIWYLLELAESEYTTPFIITLNTLKEDEKWGKIERLHQTIKARMNKEIKEKV